MSLDITGVTLHRTGRGPAVAFIHCLGADHHLWDETVAALAPDLHCLSYDLPGHGASAAPQAPLSAQQLSDQLAALLDRAGVATASVVGISIGGLVALDFAARHAGRLGRLVLVDTAPFYPEATHATWRGRAATARTEGVAALISQILPAWFTAPTLHADTAGVRLARNALQRANAEGYARGAEMLMSTDLRPALGAIRAPTLILCGDQDMPLFRDAAVSMQAAIAGSRLEWIAPAGHASVLEQPAQVQQRLREFLAR